MNGRYAAALALVGWYLMVPDSTDLQRQLNPETKKYEALAPPIREWSINQSFDTAAECEAVIKESTQRAQKDCPDCVVLAKCIATDDPRLKE